MKKGHLSSTWLLVLISTLVLWEELMTRSPDFFVLVEFSWSSSLVLLILIDEGSLVTEASLSPILFYTIGLGLNSTLLVELSKSNKTSPMCQSHLQSLINCKYSNREKTSRLV